MTHIIFTTSEKANLQATILPEGTTLVETSNNGNKTLYRFVVHKGKWIIEVDFREKDRGWKKGEEEAFKKNMSKKRVLDFFLKRDESDNIPQREYSLMSNLEYDYFKFIRHDGSYLNDEKTGKQYNLFRISLNKDSNIDEAQREIGKVLNKIAAHYPKWSPIYIGIFEHTLSQHGIYFVYWDRKKSFKLMKCTYGREEVLQECNGLISLLTYIANCHYCQEVT